MKHRISLTATAQKKAKPQTKNTPAFKMLARVKARKYRATMTTADRKWSGQRQHFLKTGKLVSESAFFGLRPDIMPKEFHPLNKLYNDNAIEREKGVSEELSKKVMSIGKKLGKLTEKDSGYKSLKMQYDSAIADFKKSNEKLNHHQKRKAEITVKERRWQADQKLNKAIETKVKNAGVGIKNTFVKGGKMLKNAFREAKDMVNYKDASNKLIGQLA